MRKRAVKVSVALNVALSLALILILAQLHKTAPLPGQTPTGTPARAPSKEMDSASQFVPAAPREASFRWSQLQSPDYRHYVSNLREIGCPEAALRAIVTSDLDATYENRARQLERTLTEIRNAPLSTRLRSFSTEQALQAQLQQLSAEENAEISNLLGLNMAASEVSAEPTVAGPASARRQAAAARVPPRVPLVFQDLDPSALRLNSDQTQVIEDLRRSFSDAVGGPDQDPNDPAYLERWQKAQPEIDSELRGMLGVEVFEKYEMAIQPPQNPPAQH